MVNNTTVLALKELCVKVAGDGTTIDDIKGNTIPEVIEDITKRYIGASAESINQAVTEWLEKNSVDINEDKVNQIVEQKITQAVNSISNPFTTAYWRDSSDGNIYLVSMVNGALSITKQDNSETEEVLDDLIEDRLLLWHDEFSGSAINTDYWTVYEGDLNNSGKRYNRPENISVKNSICTLSMKREDYTVGDKTYQWTSGALESVGKVHVGKGTIEAKIRISDADEYLWTAFWIMGYGSSWPTGGEIDLLEYNCTGNKAVECNVHYNTKSKYNDSIGYDYKNAISELDVSEWHRYRLIIGSTNLQIFIDDISVAKLDYSSIDFFAEAFNSSSTAINPWSMLQHFMRLTMNLASMPTDSKTRTMEIDWVRYYAPSTVTEIPESTNPLIGIGANDGSASEVTIDISKIIPRNHLYSGDKVRTLRLTTDDNYGLLGHAFESDNDDCISIGNFGQLLFRKQGTANITCKAKSHSGKEYTVARKIIGTMNAIEISDIGIYNNWTSNYCYSIKNFIWTTSTAYGTLKNFVNVEPNTVYNFGSITDDYAWYIVELDESGTPIVGESGEPTYTKILDEGQFTTSENTKYLALSIRTATYSSTGGPTVLTAIQNGTIIPAISIVQ